MIKKLGYPQIRLIDFRIQNVVSSHDVGFLIRLESLYVQAMQRKIVCRYDPELFPGLIFRMKEPKVVLLIFASGKLVITGAKSREQVYEVHDKIMPVLSMH